MTLLYCIRHGETAWNTDGRFQGHQNTPLNATGRAQAAMLATALAGESFEAMYTSDLARAAETAALVAAPHQRTPVPDTRLREAFFGEWEGHSITEVTARWPELVAAWRADSLHTRPPGGETLEQVSQRVVSLLEDIVARYPEGKVAIVGHGGSVRAIIAHALGADLSIFRRLRLDNCSLSIVQSHADGRLVLTRMNDLCHLAHECPEATGDEAGDHLRL